MADIFDLGLQNHKIKMDGKFFEGNLIAVTGDTARRLSVQLLNSDGLVQNTTGLEVRLNANINKKATFTIATLKDATQGIYEIDLSNGMLLAPGTWSFQWQVISVDGKKINSFPFTGYIGTNLSEGGTQAKNFYLNLDNLQDLIVDITDKDVISGPEIILARGGESTLGARLDKSSSQLERTAKESKSGLYATNKRVDNLIIPSGNTDAEVADSRTSVVKNVEFDTLSNRMEDIEKFILKGNTEINLLWEQGTISEVSGGDYISTSAIRTQRFNPQKDFKIEPTKGLEYRLVYYPNGVYERRGEIIKTTTYIQHVLGMEYRLLALTGDVEKKANISVKENASDGFSEQKVGEIITNKINFLTDGEKKVSLDLWEQGTINPENGDNSYSLNSIRSSGYHELKTGLTLKASDGYLYRVVYYPKGIYKERGIVLSGTSYIPYEKDMYIRIVLSKPNIKPDNKEGIEVYTYFPIAVAQKEKESNVITDKIRVMSYNVGSYNRNDFGHPNDGNLDGVVKDFRKLYAEVGVDIILVQEDRDHVDKNNTLPVLTEVYKPFAYKALSPYSGYATQRGYSHFPISDVYSKELINQSSVGFKIRRLKFNVRINGKIVTCISSHLILGVEHVALRQLQMQELLNEVKSEERFIIAMDSNVDSVSEYDLFNEYNISNTGYFGTFPTSQNSGLPRDVIVTNMDIVNVEMPDSLLSDHYPMVADIIVR